MTYPGSNQDLTGQNAGQTDRHDSPEPTPNARQQPGNHDPTATSSPPNGSAPPQADGTVDTQQSEQQPGTSTTHVAINIPGSMSSGGPTTVAGVLYQFATADQSHKGEEEKSLFDFVKPLSSRSERHYRPSQANLQEMVASLIRDQVILISAPYDEYAFDAAWAVIEAMPESPDRFNGSLAFEDTVGKGVEFSLQKLCEQRPDAEPTIVLLVDAFDSQANTFPNSMLGHYARVEAAKQDLKNSKLFLVLVVNHKYASEKNLSQPNRSYKSLSYWNIPFLEPFFKKWFADHDQLLAELAKQRAKWEEDESTFTQQVVNYQANDILRDVISNGGPKDPDSSAESMLKIAGPVEKTVLYTATFFNEITSPEFCRVVESLLGTRTTLKDSPTISINGATPATAKIEVPLSRIWDEEKDEIFTKLLVETSTATDSPLTVSLSEFNLAEPLRKLFERRHRLYLIDQFRALQQTGIFFYPSLRLARKTTQLAIDLAQLYPDEFNEGWIVTLVMRIREHFASDEDRAEDPMFRFLSNTQLGAANIAFARVSDICRRFLDSPQRNVVPNSLEYLMKNEYQQEVLWLIKQLKFNPEFDDWHWLKQLLNQADLKTKYQTYYYLLSYLKQLGTRVYEGLKKLEGWLPPADRSNFTDFDKFIFRTLIKYCLDTIDRFNEKHYGKWPSRYPLFTLTDAETANSRFGLLANCLLHPGVDPTLVGLKVDGTRIDLIGILLAEWSFILLGTPSVPPTPPGNRKEDLPSDLTQNCTASQMFNLLLTQFLSRLDSRQHLELLKHWTKLDAALFKFGHSYSTAREQRNEMKWKRALVQRLIRELKLIPAAKPSRPNSPGPIVTSIRA
jgi:hypothetical protein